MQSLCVAQSANGRYTYSRLRARSVRSNICARFSWRSEKLYYYSICWWWSCRIVLAPNITHTHATRRRMTSTIEKNIFFTWSERFLIRRREYILNICRAKFIFMTYIHIHKCVYDMIIHIRRTKSYVKMCEILYQYYSVCWSRNWNKIGTHSFKHTLTNYPSSKRLLLCAIFRRVKENIVWDFCEWMRKIETQHTPTYRVPIIEVCEWVANFCVNAQTPS